MSLHTGRAWTLRRAEHVWKQLRAGMNVKTVAALQGCSVANIHRRLRCAGYDPAEARRQESLEELQAAKIYARRKQGVEFADIAIELGMEPTREAQRCLYMRLVRYCERAEVQYPRMLKKRAPYKPVPCNPDLSLIEPGTALLRKAPLDPEVFCMQLGVNTREVKFIIAEMRRRNIIANGLVPTEKQDTDRPGSELAVMEAVRLAWDTPTQPCETLGTLTEKLPFMRGTVNLAIVNLRRDGLIAPRGLLYLRKTYA